MDQHPALFEMAAAEVRKDRLRKAEGRRLEEAARGDAAPRWWQRFHRPARSQASGAAVTPTDFQTA